MKAKWFRAVRPRALAVALLYAAVMAFLTFEVLFLAFGFSYLIAGWSTPLISVSESVSTVTVTPSIALYAVAIAAAPLYFLQGYRLYTRGRKWELLMPPILLGAIAIAIVTGGLAAYNYVSALASAAQAQANVAQIEACARSCPCGMKSWTGPSENITISITSISRSTSPGKCECYPCKP
ncbi:hypothetical protein IG193_01095 [Infirmifilum lucidum]|uniref:Uncharacterized protein n=1 Tax=Infirmifilum lucidum TaxID=2776706 RepID=A0A7L9FJ87_9CREN|nr:hypothetical protein [Infirmifilum lucidum]QOJ79093.1 hypothetical protein IG193_01095 [Infirmifilum lucidum]